MLLLPESESILIIEERKLTMNALFSSGNLDAWNFSISSYLPAAMHTITKTVDPVISAALIALVGDTSSFSREEGLVNFEYDDLAMPFKAAVTLTYSVPSFKLEGATEEAVQQDRSFVLGYLAQLKEIEVVNVLIDNRSGTLTVQISVGVGYKL